MNSITTELYNDIMSLNPISHLYYYDCIELDTPFKYVGPPVYSKNMDSASQVGLLFKARNGNIYFIDYSYSSRSGDFSAYIIMQIYILDSRVADCVKINDRMTTGERKIWSKYPHFRIKIK